MPKKQYVLYMICQTERYYAKCCLFV